MAILAIPDKGSEVEEMEEEKINPDLARLDERFLDKPGFATEEWRSHQYGKKVQKGNESCD